MIQKTIKRYAVVCLFVTLGLLTANVFAQDQARITGTVKDSTEAVIPGVSISIKNDRTGEERTTLTGDRGEYSVAALKPSSYTVVASLVGFSQAEATGLQLVVGQTMNVDLTIRPAGVAQAVTVEADAAEVRVETSSSSIGANVDVREVGSLPINGRQLSQLYLQAPGSVNTGSGTFGDIRFSGRAVEQNVIRYDGIEGSAIIDASPGNLNGEVPSPFRLQSSLENVQEFRVESNNFPAEYGTGTGGQITVVTKSGSNLFHGSLFNYLRNDVLDARNFFDRDKAPLRSNQFGGSIGGPIVENRAFFFASYEGYRLRNGINFIEAVPSAAARLRAVPAVLPLFDAFRDPKAVLLPGASTNTDFDIVQLVGRNVVDENAVSARLDFKLNERHSMYARFFRDQASNDAPEGVTGRHVVVRTTPQNGILSFQSTIGSTSVNQFKFGFNEALTRINGQAPTVNGLDISAITLNITGSVANSGIAGQGSGTGVAIPGGLVRTNSATNGRGAPYTPYSLSFIDNFSWAKGNHTPKLGVELRLIRMYTDRLGGTTYTFSNLNAFLANQAQSIQYLGDLSAPSVFNGGAIGQRFAKQQYYIAFAQDSWRVSPKVTLNYGVRYEYYSPLREDRDLTVQFDTKTGVLLPPTRDPYQTSKNNFGPRVGLSYSLKPETVIRGGFGIYYGPGQTEDQIQPIESDRVSSTISNGAFPADINAIVTNFINNPQNRQYQPRAYAAEYKVPERVYQYSFSLQQELPGRFVATAAYVGSQGRNLFLRSVANQIVSVQTNSDPTQNAVVIRQFDIVNGSTILRPYAEVDTKTTGGHDNYNAMQLSLVRRSANGLTMNSQYTYGMSKGNTAGSNEALTAGNNAVTLDQYDYDDGYNNFDVRHTFNLSAIYELPFGAGRRFLGNLSGVANGILGGWEIGAIVNARSGLPVNLLVTRPDVVYVDAAGAVFASPAANRTAVINTPGGGSSRNIRRPDVVPGVNPYLDDDRAFLNPAAFAIPKPGTFGNAIRNEFRGPNFRQADLVLNKRFVLRESANVEFRTEVFNILNMTNFANPPATLPNALGTGAGQIQPGQPFTAASAGTFGILNSTVTKSVGLGTNRQIQFALKLNF